MLSRGEAVLALRRREVEAMVADLLSEKDEIPQGPRTWVVELSAWLQEHPTLPPHLGAYYTLKRMLMARELTKLAGPLTEAERLARPRKKRRWVTSDERAAAKRPKTPAWMADPTKLPRTPPPLPRQEEDAAE